ncbi:MAG TPA: hypothetical protein VLJ42_03465 [Solirubrobacteraceae bacterium]|nr:hypothetical protein [Solirubrobacteraceae bacterium]
MSGSSQQRRQQQCSHAFGLNLRFSTLPPGAWEQRSSVGPDVSVELVAAATLAEAWSGRAGAGWEATIDGEAFVVEVGQAGDHLFAHGDRAQHHLSADGGVLRCVADPHEPVRWWRVVLDSVLFTVALSAGYEALHAGAVTTPGGALAITAGAGGGKSTLLAELLGRGLGLLSDDVVVLQARGEERPLAHPGAPLMTVPSALAPAVGRVIAAVGDEAWVGVPVNADALELGAIVVLDRRAGLSTGLHRIDAPLATLMGALLQFPKLAARERARFELAAAIAGSTPVWRLTAAPTVDPGALADVLLADGASLTGQL